MVKAHASLAKYSIVQLSQPLFLPSGATFPKGLEMQMAFQGAGAVYGKPWAVVIEPIASGKLGWCVTSGIAMASVIIGNNTAPNRGCDVDAGSLVAKEGGAARILYRQAGTGPRPCVIDLCPITPRFFIGRNAAFDIEPDEFGTITAVGDSQFVVQAKNESETGNVKASAKVGCTWDDIQGLYVVTMEFCDE